MDRMKITRDEATREVESNHEFFLTLLSGLLATNEGEWCLLRDRRIIQFYPTMEAAYLGGLARYPDRRFSIQEVCDAPLNMGIHAVAL